MDKPKEQKQSLDELRKQLDALDRDLMDRFAERIAVVGKIAQHKQELGLPIRDFELEEAKLQSRAQESKTQNLPTGVVEAVFRLLLMMSRDHQAKLAASIPVQESARRVAVIGGLGGMGKRLVDFFEGLGHEVQAVDLQTDLRPVDAAKDADVVVVSVPIRATVKVIQEVGPHLKEGALLMDVTSLKQAPMKAMLESTKASVVGTHPMFGPGVHSLEGQKVVLCRGRGDNWFDWVHRMFLQRGLKITETSADQHDKMMAVVQVLNHFRTQVLGHALSRMGVSMAESLEFTSPAYLLESYVTARHFAQASELYGPIEMLNPELERVTKTFLESAEKISSILHAGDQKAFDQIFDEVRAFFGDFATEAVEQTSLLIDRLIELSPERG